MPIGILVSKEVAVLASMALGTVTSFIDPGPPGVLQVGPDHLRRLYPPSACPDSLAFGLVSQILTKQVCQVGADRLYVLASMLRVAGLHGHRGIDCIQAEGLRREACQFLIAEPGVARDKVEH